MASEIRLQWNGGLAVQSEGDVIDIQPIGWDDIAFPLIDTSDNNSHSVVAPEDTRSVTIIGFGSRHIIKVGSSIGNVGLVCPAGFPRTIEIGVNNELQVKALTEL